MEYLAAVVKLQQKCQFVLGSAWRQRKNLLFKLSQEVQVSTSPHLPPDII